MSAAPLDALAERYAALREALGALPAADRGLAREALRDALDRDADDLREPRDLVAGTFRVEGEIRRGPAFRLVLLRHRDLGTRHVLKTLAPGRETDPVLRELLRREAAHQLRLSDAAVLPARALLRLHGGAPGLLVDHVDGTSLAARLERTPRLPTPDLRALAERLLGALGAVHAAGLLHLDLAPGNVLLPAGDPAAALLADFGLSLPLGAPLRARSEGLERARTPGFAAPETSDPDAAPDARADLFALGRTLLAAGAGEQPELRRFARDLASPDPGERPESATAALARLPALRHSRNIDAFSEGRGDDPAHSTATGR